MSRAKMTILALTLSGLPPAPLQALATEFEVTANAGTTVFAANHVGDFIVAWSEGNTWYARVHAAADGSLGPSLVLTESSSEHPPWEVSSVALGPDRSFVVGRWGWYASLLGTGNAMRAFDAHGVPLGDDSEVGGFDSRQPTILMDASGRFLIAYGQTCWLGPAGCGPMEAVHGIRYVGIAGPAQSVFRVDDQTGVHISMNASGAFLLSWISNTQPRAFVMRAISQDNVAEPDREVAQSGSDRITSSRSYLNEDGSFTAVWSTSQGLHGRHYGSAGLPGPPFGFVDAPGGSIVPEAAGLILLGTQADGSLMARRYGFAGNPRGPAFQVNVDAGGSNAFVGGAVLTQGDFVVVWRRGSGVYGRILDATTGVERSSWSDVKSRYRR